MSPKDIDDLLESVCEVVRQRDVMRDALEAIATDYKLTLGNRAIVKAKEALKECGE